MAEEQRGERKDEPSSSSSPPKEPEKEKKEEGRESGAVLHKIKTIHFFGRTTPIILQNDNGPCPLLAICNVLLLKNQLSLNPDITEVSQETLLSLIAERLIDANSNVNNKDAGYVENQQQNIADAMNSLPRLTTGIDVNTKFCRINDFEFTPECAIFDLLDIPLYHGWLVDPQDHETVEAIGSKSYNAIMSDLVSLETQKMENEGKDKVDEDCIDFAAATTATLGVPSPCLSRGKSFGDSPRSASGHYALGKGDAEEEAEVMRALKLSENESSSIFNSTDMSTSSDENLHMVKSVPVNLVNISEGHSHSEVSSVESSVTGSIDVSANCETNASVEDNAAGLTLNDSPKEYVNQSATSQPVEGSSSNNWSNCGVSSLILDDTIPSLSPVKDTMVDQEVASLSNPASDFVEESQRQSGNEIETLAAGPACSESSTGSTPVIEAVEPFTPSLDGSEPIYEGEECILDSVKTICEDREPVYEGEVVLAEQADKGAIDACGGSSNDAMTLRQGELISDFLKNNASQLTFHGLFSLQEGVNERELCVFFRNNHFSTMFKFEGELYLLATDQGFLNQPDLVWEKLNEVNGDTLYMTSTFKEFRLEGSNNGTWDQRNAVASTADYMASIDDSTGDGSNMNPDWLLAIELQKQEFEEQQQQPQPQRNSSQQPSLGGGNSRLVTGPQVSRSSGKATSSSSRQDQKSKEKSSNCKLM